MKKPLALLLFLLMISQFTFGEDRQPHLPDWLSNFPQAADPLETRLPRTMSVAYAAPAPIAAVLTHYQEQLRKANVAFTTTDYGTGKMIWARTSSTSCDVRLYKADSGSYVFVVCTSDDYGKTSENDGKDSCVVRVYGADGGTLATRIDCAPEAPNGVFRAPLELRTVVPTTDRQAQTDSAASLKLLLEKPHEVEYSIDGSAPEVGITARNSMGGTEQHEVSVPYRTKFNAGGGAFVYLSAQKKGKDGTIHVSIRVDGQVLQEATASSPYGIATASGRVAK